MTEPTEGSVTRMSDRLRPLVLAAVEQHGQPDQVTWDAFPQMFPSPTSEGLITVFGVYLEIPGAVVGTTVQGSMAIQPNATEEHVNEGVRQFLESLRQGRSNQLNAMEQQQTMAARNGNTTPSNGLIVPGQ